MGFCFLQLFSDRYSGMRPLSSTRKKESVMETFNAVAWIVIVNLALYMKTLRYKFVSDDFTVWKNPPVAKNLWHRLWLEVTGQKKIYARSIRFARANGKLYMAIIRCEEMEHLFTIALHTAICVTIYFAFGASWVSFVAAMLYSTNPVNNQGTIWPSGRGYVYPILFLLLAMALPMASPLFLYAGTWYTAGFLAPLALIGSKWWYLLGLMPVIWYLHTKKFTKAVKNKQNMECFDEDKVIHPRKLILAVKTFGFYLTLCIIPFRITFYHNFLQSAAGSMKHKCYTLCRYFWIGVAGIVGMVAYGCLLPWDTFIWALLAFSLTIIPFCNFVRANQEIAERFAALPNVFLMYALAHLIAPYTALFTAFLAFYATRTFYTLTLYKDEYFITEHAIIEDPHAWWAWHCRAMKRWDTQSYKEALILWVMAKLISPREFKVLMNIATCLRLLKNDKEADEYLELAAQNVVAGQEAEAARFIAEHKKGKLPILL